MAAEITEAATLTNLLPIIIGNDKAPGFTQQFVDQSQARVFVASHLLALEFTEREQADLQAGKNAENPINNTNGLARSKV